jgi:hypothetical protein
MGSFIDLAGKKFSKLRVINRASNGSRGTRWNCVCECGNSRVVAGIDLRREHTKSCGCYKREVAAKNGRNSGHHLIKSEEGKKYGSLLVLGMGDSCGEKMWLCRCDCGNEKLIRGSSLRRGTTKSCGCHTGVFLPQGESSFNALLKRYQFGAKNRGVCFDLTPVEFRQIINRPCHYCGIEPSREFCASGNGSYIYSGIDRYDSLVGYTPENVVPCCTECNVAKSDRNTSEFIEWIHRASRYLSHYATVELEEATGQSV